MSDIFSLDIFKTSHLEPISVSILNMLTEGIISGKLKPGDKLPTEYEIAEKLSVGRNSVREAIKMLSSLGVVEIKRGTGTFIAGSMSTSILDPLILSLVFEQGTSMDLIELRLLLEMDAAGLVIDKADDEDVQKLEEVNFKLKEVAQIKTRTPHLLRDLDLNVHYLLFDLTRNRLFAKIAKAIYRLFYASIEKTVEMDPLKAFSNHQDWIEAIKMRNKELVKKTIQEGLSFWIDYMQK